ncbi:MAG TPA: YtxH domain-containing protein [Terriglobales bacterium]|nr:YtxH domain-containing protein [Terriglobales bacterium]
MASDNGGSSFGWFLAGLGLGALLGVLYAPKSGEETRRQILDAAEESKDYVNTQARRAREQAAQWADKGREVLERQKQQFGSAVEAGRQAYREATENK